MYGGQQTVILDAKQRVQHFIQRSAHADQLHEDRSRNDRRDQAGQIKCKAENLMSGDLFIQEIRGNVTDKLLEQTHHKILKGIFQGQCQNSVALHIRQKHFEVTQRKGIHKGFSLGERQQDRITIHGKVPENTVQRRYRHYEEEQIPVDLRFDFTI